MSLRTTPESKLRLGQLSVELVSNDSRVLSSKKNALTRERKMKCAGIVVEAVIGFHVTHTKFGSVNMSFSGHFKQKGRSKACGHKANHGRTVGWAIVSPCGGG